MTQNGDVSEIGDRTPALFLIQTGTDLSRLHFTSTLNGIKSRWFNSEQPLNLSENYEVEIRQRYTGAGVYKFSVVINGKEEDSIDNTQAEQFYNVKVYAGDPWYDACIGTVTDFQITNFL